MLAAVFVVGVMVIGFLGPGEAPVDRLMGIGVSGPVGLVIVVGLAVLGATVLLAATWQPAQSPGG